MKHKTLGKTFIIRSRGCRHRYKVYVDKFSEPLQLRYRSKTGDCISVTTVTRESDSKIIVRQKVKKKKKKKKKTQAVAPFVNSYKPDIVTIEREHYAESNESLQRKQ